MTTNKSVKELYDEYIRLIKEKGWDDEWMQNLGYIAHRAKIPSCYFKSNSDALFQLIEITKKNTVKFDAYSEFMSIITSKVC